jgi:hypothetical protein
VAELPEHMVEFPETVIVGADGRLLTFSVMSLVPDEQLIASTPLHVP